MSKTKKFNVKFTAFLMIFVISVTYFSLLTPTSAYFFKSETKEDQVTFALLSVSENETVFDKTVTLQFPAATKFWDTNEPLFDDVAIVKTVTLTNNGDADARIYAHITPDNTSVSNGLKYMITKIDKVTVSGEAETTTSAESALAEETTTEETTSVSTLQKLPIKEYIESELGLTADTPESNAVSKLNEYNELSKNKYATIKSGESAEVQIVFWSEYGNIEGTLKDTANVQSIDYTCHVEIIASQDSDDAMTMTAQ